MTAFHIRSSNHKEWCSIISPPLSHMSLLSFQLAEHQWLHGSHSVTDKTALRKYSEERKEIGRGIGRSNRGGQSVIATKVY
jgi:hypothetical protein